jgi:hypothetical protein
VVCAESCECATPRATGGSVVVCCDLLGSVPFWSVVGFREDVQMWYASECVFGRGSLVWGVSGSLFMARLYGLLRQCTFVPRLVNNQAACKRLIDSLITINPIKSSSPILIF